MSHPVDLLAPLIGMARKTLQRLDEDEVPAVLRRVAAHSGPKLPPPLARRLVDELDGNEWLREQVRDAWPQADPDAEDLAEAASAMFLLRPSGWEAALAATECRAATAGRAARIAELEAEVAALRDEIERYRRRARRAQREAEMAATEADRRVTAARSSAAALRDEEQEELAALRREVASLTRAVDESRRDLESSRARVRGLRSELLKARRAARPTAAATSPRVWESAEPLAAARLLDEIQAAFRPDTAFEEQWLPPEDRPLELPVGVRPDTSEAIDWLLRSERAVTFVVDGYNVTHLLAPDTPASGRSRERLNRDLGRLRRLAQVTPRVLVVYDSSVAGGITSEVGPGGIEIRFTAEGHQADDEILMVATELGSRAVVVSSDRRVREGAERLGALGLWADALVTWIRQA